MNELEYLIRACEKLSKIYDETEEVFNILVECGGDNECKRFRVWIMDIDAELSMLLDTLRKTLDEMVKECIVVEEKTNYWGE